MKNATRHRHAKSAGDEALIRRAEAALESLSSHFPQWMEDECRRLESIGDRIRDGDHSAETLEALYRAAHDIESEAELFGYPRVQASAGALCALLTELKRRGTVPAQTISRFVADIRIAVEQK
jgi:hypothetical protein